MIHGCNLMSSMIVKSKKVTWNIVIRRLLLFLVIICSGGIEYINPDILLVFMLIIALYVLDFKIRLPKNGLLAYIFVISYVILFFVRPFELNLFSFVARTSYFLVSFLVVMIYRKDGYVSFLRDLWFICYIFVWQTIITVFLAIVLREFFLQVTINNIDYSSFLFVFNFHEMIKNHTSFFVRPDGIFYEPGVLQLYLNLFLYMALFIYKRIFCVFLAVIAVVCTQSSTGLLIMALLILVNIMQVSTFNLRKNFFPIVIILSLPFLYIIAEQNAINKISGSGAGSSIARMYDFNIGVKLIQNNILFGIGNSTEEYIRQSHNVGFAETVLAQSQIEERTSSNGLLIIFIAMGIPLGGMALIGLYRQKIFPNSFIIFVSFTMALTGENLFFTPFFIIVMFSGFVGRKSPSLSD